MNDEQNRHLLSEAHERATDALNRVKGHEDLCAERYKGIHDALADIKLYQSVMNARMWGAVSIIITLLLGILGYMITKSVDHVLAESLRSALIFALYGDLS
jgi:hypothetical protein